MAAALRKHGWFWLLAVGLTGCGAFNAPTPAGSFLADTGACSLVSDSLQVNGTAFTACRMHFDGTQRNYNWQLLVDPSAPWTVSAPPIQSLNFSISQAVVAPALLGVVGEATIYPASVAAHSAALLYVDPNNKAIEGTGSVQVNVLGESSVDNGDEFAGIFNVALSNGIQVQGSVDMMAIVPNAPVVTPSTY